MSKVYLVSCVALKRDGQHAAKDLYTSIWFGKVKCTVEDTKRPWFILSSLYGLVHPDDVIATYEKTLNSMRKAERLRWADSVFADMLGQEEFQDATEIVFVAGHRYRADLIPLIREYWPDKKITIPMEGLQIGYQLQWLKNNAL